MDSNALGTPRNTFKSQQSVKKKKKKIGEIGKKSDFFLKKMDSNALGTPRKTFKSQNLAKKNIKSGKIGLS